MRLLPLSAILATVLLLSACSGDNAPSAPAAAGTPVAAAVPAPAADPALSPLFGTWAIDPAQCAGPVLTISKARFEGAENGCDITGFTDDGNGSFTAAMDCAGEGTTASESIRMRPIFSPSGEGIELTYLQRNNLTTTVLRCPAPAAN